MNANNAKNANKTIPAHIAVNKLAKLMASKASKDGVFTLSDEEFTKACGTSHTLRWLIHNANLHGKKLEQLLKESGGKFAKNSLQVLDLKERRFAVGLTDEQLYQQNPVGQDAPRLANTLAELAEDNRYGTFGLNWKRLEEDYPEHVGDNFEALVKAAMPLANHKLRALSDDMVIRYKDLENLHFTCFGNINDAMIDLAHASSQHIVDAHKAGKSNVSIPFDDIFANTRGHHYKWLTSDNATCKLEQYEGMHVVDIVNDMLKSSDLMVEIDHEFKDELVFRISKVDPQFTAADIITPEPTPAPLKQSWADLTPDSFPTLPGAKPTKQSNKSTKPKTEIAPVSIDKSINIVVAELDIEEVELEIEEAELALALKKAQLKKAQLKKAKLLQAQSIH